MILSKYVYITIRPLNYNRYKKYYSDIKINKKYRIKAEHLLCGSAKKIKCQCEICGSKQSISYRKYLQNKNNYGYYSCFGCKQLKLNRTKEIIYGDKNYNNPEKMRRTKQDKGIYLTDKKLTLFELYRKKVLKLSFHNKKKIFDNWDGYDYYDNEYIKAYLKEDSNSKLYPTIDHKISVLYGFKNNIDPGKISAIENLCITKKSINSKKGSKNYCKLKI